MNVTAKFIAEVSSNHNASLSRSLKFIDKAAELGCWGVKFQLFEIESLFAPEILNVSKNHRNRKRWELPIDFIPDLARRCQEKKIKFICTPFFLKAVDILYPYVDAYKIASYEILWLDLIKACAKTSKPIILSTGMAKIHEISEAVHAAKSAGCIDLTLLHCVSGYPTPAEECNLSAIKTLRNKFHCSVGWSDHSANPAVINRAVHKWEAATVEFHLDLDRLGNEFESKHCWLPEQILETIRSVNIGNIADGSGEKTPMQTEYNDRDWRADPSDGLRPLKKLRENWKQK